MNAPRLTRRDFTAGLGGIVLSFSLTPPLAFAQEPPRLPGSHERSFGARTSRLPLVYSTRVCSAALRSSAFDASVGSTVTVVVPASPALTRMSPLTTVTIAVIGLGVSKVGMVS